jgi:hypothetical protein
MSLYTAGEICKTCPHATLHECGNCLKACDVDWEPDVVFGTCIRYAGQDPRIIERRTEHIRVLHAGKVDG